MEDERENNFRVWCELAWRCELELYNCRDFLKVFFDPLPPNWDMSLHTDSCFWKASLLYDGAWFLNECILWLTDCAYLLWSVWMLLRVIRYVMDAWMGGRLIISAALIVLSYTLDWTVTMRGRNVGSSSGKAVLAKCDMAWSHGLVGVTGAMVITNAYTTLVELGTSLHLIVTLLVIITLSWTQDLVSISADFPIQNLSLQLF